MPDAKGVYEIVCADNSGNFTYIQKCDLTLLTMIVVGEFIGMYAIYNTLTLDYKLN